MVSHNNYAVSNLAIILSTFNINQGDIFNNNKVRIRHFVRENINKPSWQSAVIKEFLNASEGHLKTNLTAKEIQCIIDVCTD